MNFNSNFITNLQSQIKGGKNNSKWKKLSKKSLKLKWLWEDQSPPSLALRQKSQLKLKMTSNYTANFLMVDSTDFFCVQNPTVVHFS